MKEGQEFLAFLWFDEALLQAGTLASSTTVRLSVVDLAKDLRIATKDPLAGNHQLWPGNHSFPAGAFASAPGVQRPPEADVPI